MPEQSSVSIFGVLYDATRRSVAIMTAPVRAVYRGITRDGTIGASFNTARDELKEGLRAFPDSIHVQPVSIAQQGDTASVHGRKSRQPTPSEIAKEKSPDQPPRDPGPDRGRDPGKGRSRGRE